MRRRSGPVRSPVELGHDGLTVTAPHSGLQRVSTLGSPVGLFWCVFSPVSWLAERERGALRAACGMAAPRPIKGILKNKNSGARVCTEPPPESTEPGGPGGTEEDQQKKSQKWDEMNILATYHPPDKDYGLMKIDEPSTPYNRMVGDEEDDEVHSDGEGNAALTVDDLAKKLAAAEGTEPRFMRQEEESSEEEEELTPEEQAKKKQFEMMRKMHYNEGLNIKLARQLIASELEEEEDEDEEMRDDTETEDINVDPPQEADSLDS
ncbi:protein phosphatase inhibitor 2 isoform X1 [Pygocentrus nattereri]|uniref:Protein phosphatase 1, regulatory (inhibitor) subunit 2 n=1 Tax=Pygocentrus nattereri TaxID=42514 RepID=A0A3B4DNT3_PYGNA|nr:protein phosphatase inhibitor 2 isoform X1 [Pygocentrus nattereri]